MWVKSWLLNRKCKGPFKNVLYDCPCKRGTLSTVHTYSTCEWITAIPEVDMDTNYGNIKSTRSGNVSVGRVQPEDK